MKINEFVDLEVLILNEIKSFHEKNDTVISKLKTLIKKEDDIINKLPRDSYSLNRFYDIILDKKDELFNDESEAIMVLNRIGNILIDMSNIYYDEETFNEGFDRYIYRNKIRDNYNVSFILYLENMKEYIYDEDLEDAQIMTLYYYKNISDRLIDLNFDYSKLSHLSPLEEARELPISYLEYKYLYNDELYDSLGDLFFQILERSFHDGDSKIIDYNFYLFKYLLSLIDEEYLRLFKECFEDTIVSLPDNRDIDKMKEMILNEFSFRNISSIDTEVSIEENLSNFNEEYDNVVSLIKNTEYLYDTFMASNFDNIDVISDIVEKEKTLINSLGSYELLYDMVQNLDMDSQKFKFIKNRILSIISLSDKLSFHVKNNLSLEVMEKHFDDDFDFYKMKIFESGYLTDELIGASGNYKIMGPFSDDISSFIFSVSEEEYMDSKRKYLFDLALDILREINYLDKLELQYNLYLLETIIDYLDKNLLLDLKSEIDKIIDNDVKKMILNRLHMG